MKIIVKLSLGCLATGFIIVAVIGWLWSTPRPAFSHGEEKHTHDLEKLPAKPEGMIEFGKEDAPGSEYLPEEPAKQMDHDMGHMGHDMSSDPFLKRGEHDMSNLQKPVTKARSLLNRGRNIYLHMCVYCHGRDGNGGGNATDYLYPWPRDFRKGIFKFRSTPTGTLPKDEDLYRTIINGVPGTSMPAWGEALSPQDTWALVNLIKSFSDRFRQEAPGKSLSIKPLPSSEALVAKGKQLYIKHKCTDCHGATGQGNGRLAESLMDAWKHAVFVHDITNPNYFKAGFKPEDIFRTLSTGLDGTPMNSYAHLPEEDRWALTHYIRSNFRKGFQKGEFETDIVSYNVPFELDTNPDSPVWKDVKSTNLVLRPLSARRGAIEIINVASVNNGEVLAVRLKWKDTTKNGFVDGRADVFTDGVAVQMALGDVTLHTHGHNEPFFGMGNRGKPVNIWHWKAGLEETLEASEDSEYSTGGVDMDALIFGGVMSSPVTKMRTTQEHTVEELNSEGFGSITPQPEEYQNVEGTGVWKDGEWTVVFTRTFAVSGRWDAIIDRKDPLLVAFAVWDGEKEDRNGRKVVSVWQRLNILHAPSPNQKN
jgi:DMSO reductase family type II enzyme heme b subunit